MKKTLIVLALGLTIDMVAGDTYAQNSQKNMESERKMNFMPSIHNLSILKNPDVTDVHLLSRNEIDIRVVRDFLMRFDEVENVLWFAVPKGGYEAYFVRDGFGERVIYDKGGGWEQSLLTYDEYKCPRDIRAAVRSLFFDFDIFLVREIDNIEGAEFIFYLQDKSTIRVVRVNKEDEVEVLQEFDREP